MTPEFGTEGYVCWEAEYDSLSEMEETYAKWLALPGREPFFQEWAELTTGDGSRELWLLAE